LIAGVLLAVSGTLVALAVVSAPASASITTQAVSGSDSLNGVACPSATTCYAVGYNSSPEGVVVPITSGTPGSAVTVSGTDQLLGVA
jgi:hypothetical protein